MILSITNVDDNILSIVIEPFADEISIKHMETALIYSKMSESKKTETPLEIEYGNGIISIYINDDEYQLTKMIKK